MSTQSPHALPTTGTWTIDPGHSSARFSVVHHAVASFSAAFHGVTGAYDATAGRLSGSVAVDSVHLPGLDMLKAHMLTPDWFDVERFPSISFVSDDLRVEGDRLTAQGDLTIKGVTRPVVAEGSVGGRAPVYNHPDTSVSDHLGIELRTVLDRREFGLEFNNELPNGLENLGWEVTLDVALELVQADE